MFTGLIKDIGKVISVTSNIEGKLLTIKSTKLIDQINIDDSISIDGVCQTAVKVDSNSFTVQTVHVSLEKTTLNELSPNDSVNLELALRASDRLGGHFVQGHVNGMGTIHKITSTGNNYLVCVKTPSNLRKYCIKEGSIALHGISLTISEMDDETITVSVIPHTYEYTVLKNMHVGSKINIEVDVLAKYIENFMSPHMKENKISMDWLASKGFN